MRTSRVSEDYFEHVLWPAALSYAAAAKQYDDIFVISGEQSEDAVLSQAVNHICNSSAPPALPHPFPTIL